MTEYDFIDPDQPKRKRDVQRRVEAKEDTSFEDHPEIRNRAFAFSGDVDADKIVKELEEQKDNNSTIEINNNCLDTDKVGGVNNSEDKKSNSPFSSLRKKLKEIFK